jgi:hydrogenase-1 operon protein HyaF
MKEFPIPVVVDAGLLGPGSHVEDETLDYMPMPKDMHTYRPPVLPEPEELVGLDQARTALQKVLTLLDMAGTQGVYGHIPLGLMAPKDFELLNRVLGEGEASAIVQALEGDSEGKVEVRVQESIFAGVWRLMTYHDGVLVDDAIEVAPVPALFAETAKQDVWQDMPVWSGTLPPNVQNAPMLIEEIVDHVNTWRPGQIPHVVNLTLLPVTPEDIGFLDHHLGTGRVLMLSRGYGNCRISNTCLPNCWRVVYYNAMDKVILNTVEVVDMPEVAMAAPEDLRDSHERLREVMAWLEPA